MNHTMGWKAECEEWQAIADEIVDPTRSVTEGRKFKTAYDVSFEQRKRMLARGQRPMTYPEIINEHERETGACTCPQDNGNGVWRGPLEDGFLHHETCVKVTKKCACGAPPGVPKFHKDGCPNGAETPEPSAG
jgi:hypothetical protein